jgi:hypothetical protein
MLASWPLPGYSTLVATSSPVDYWPTLQVLPGQVMAVTDIAEAAADGIVTLVCRSCLVSPWVVFGLAPGADPVYALGHAVPFPTAADTRFHHYAMTLDLDAATATMWVDGVEGPTVAIDFDLRDELLDGEGHASTWCAYIPGPTLDLAIYDRLVTLSELQAQTAAQRIPADVLALERTPVRTTVSLIPARETTAVTEWSDDVYAEGGLSLPVSAFAGTGTVE